MSSSFLPTLNQQVFEFQFTLFYFTEQNVENMKLLFLPSLVRGKPCFAIDVYYFLVQGQERVDRDSGIQYSTNKSEIES